MRVQILFIPLLLLLMSGCQSPASQRLLQRAGLEKPVPQRAIEPLIAQKPVVELAQHTEDDSANAKEARPQLPNVDSSTNGMWTLSDFENLALSSNPSIARATALVEAAHGTWLQVGLPPNPAVGFEGQQVGSGGRAEQNGVFVQQEFVRGGKLSINRNVAYQEIVQAQQKLAAQQQRVLTDVRLGFSQVMLAQKQEQLTADLYRIASEGLKTTQALQQGKEIGKIDSVQAQVELENTQILVENAKNRTRAAWQVLATACGVSQLPPTALEGDLDALGTPLDWESSLENLLLNSPEIAEAQASIERARWAAERARIEKTPNVTVQGLVNWRDNGIGGRPDGALMVGIPVPIWDRNQGGIIRASQEAAAAERALEQLRLSLQNRLVPVFERYSNAYNQVERYRTKILPGAEESLELQKQSYRAGESAYVNLLTVQRTYSQTHLNYLESLRELQSARAAINGMLLSGGLEGR